tara:strand:- start:1166 stop:1450 length:285 start_codon:yes stop_codon:yes gene_type:complete
VKEFETKEEASNFVASKWGSTGLMYTWAALTGSQYKDKPPTRIELTKEDREIKKSLTNSITDETKKEWGGNELSSNVRSNYAPHPEAKGYLDTK